MRIRAFVLIAIALAGCSATPRVVDVRPGDACAHCRMTIQNARLAAEIAAPGEEPVFFDDIGCLASAIAAGKSREFAYVADHRTGAWVRAGDAVYSNVPSIDTPMSSHIIAHADDASRRADTSAASARPLSAADVFDRGISGDRHGR